MGDVVGRRDEVVDVQDFVSPSTVRIEPLWSLHRCRWSALVTHYNTSIKFCDTIPTSTNL